MPSPPKSFRFYGSFFKTAHLFPKGEALAIHGRESGKYRKRIYLISPEALSAGELSRSD
jgi:hypothetical protein